MEQREVTMKKLILLAFVGATLGGCAAQTMDEGLNGLVGQNIATAAKVLGKPDGQGELLGNTVYVWGAKPSDILPLGTMNNTNGLFRTVAASGTSPVPSPVPSMVSPDSGCTVQIAVTMGGVIQSYQWAGGPFGCARYADALPH